MSSARRSKKSDRHRYYRDSRNGYDDSVNDSNIYPRTYAPWQWGYWASDNMAYNGGDGAYYVQDDRRPRRGQQGHYVGNVYDNAGFQTYKQGYSGGSYKLKGSSSEGFSEYPGESHRRSSRRCIVVASIVGLVFLIGAGLAIGIYFGVVDKPESKPSEPTTTQAPPTELSAEVTLTLDQTFNSDLNDPDSLAYQNLEQDVTNAVDQNMKAGPMGAAYSGVQITGFGEGSVFVYLFMLFGGSTFTSNNVVTTINPTNIKSVLQAQLRSSQNTLILVDSIQVQASQVTGTSRLGEGCSSPNACAVANSICTGSPTSTCQCDATHYDNNGALKQGVCLPKKAQGDVCQDMTNCATGNSICDGTPSVCTCVDERYYNQDSDSCDPKLQQGDPGCVDAPLQCAVSGAVCESGKCACENGYQLKNNACSKLIDHEETGCDLDTDCLTPGAVCAARVCRCVSGGFFDLVSLTCETKVEYNETCTGNSEDECKTIDAQCDADTGRCLCSDTQFKNGDRCSDKTGDGEECSGDDGCSYTNSVCLLNFCTCNEDRYVNNDAESCEMKVEYDSPCRGTAGDHWFPNQCQTEGAQCNTTTQTCLCMNDQFLDVDMCNSKVAYNGACKGVSLDECATPKAKCADDTLTCKCTGNTYLNGDRCSERAGDGEECSVDNACSYANAKCLSNFCACESDRFVNDIDLSCDLRVEYDDTCKGGFTDECDTTGATCHTDEKKCLCSDDQYLNVDRCSDTVAFGAVCIGNAADECATPNAKCHSTDKKCLCIDLEFLDVDECVAQIEYNETCKGEAVDECETTDAVCDEITEKCTCSSDFFLNGDICDERVPYEGDCEGNHDDECLTEGAMCSDANKCLCMDGYFLDGDICSEQIKYDETCKGEAVEECETTAAVCDEITKTCTCSADFFLNGDICDERVPYEGDCEGNLDDECLTEGAMCSDANKCLCMDGYFLDGDICSEQLDHLAQGCTNATLQCKTKKAACVNGACDCDMVNYYADGMCNQKLDNGQRCDLDMQCIIVGAECQSICQCGTGEYSDGSTCRGKVPFDSDCDQDAMCLTTGGTCDGGKCGCRDNYVHNDVDDGCVIKKAYEEDCNFDFECITGNATCLGGKCLCADTKHLDAVRCVDKKPNGEFCDTVDECAVEGARCDDVCTCAADEYLDVSCKQKVDLGESCSSQMMCLYEGAGCSPDICACPVKTYPADLACHGVKPYQDSCVLDQECDTGTCSQNQCACLPTHYYNLNTGACETKVAYNGSCTDSTQCDTTNADCSAQGMCQCPDNNFLNNNTCFPRLGDCAAAEDCPFKDAECVDNTCICGEGRFVNTITSSCTEKKPNDDPCLSAEECAVNGAVCDGTCQCLDKYYQEGADCNLKKANGAFCKTGIECIVHRSDCLNETCLCTPSTYENFELEECEERLDYGSDCSENRQCKEEFLCNDGMCDCQEGYTYDSNSCMMVTTTTALPTTVAPDVEILIETDTKITSDEPFDNALNDPTSDTYQQKKAETEAALEKQLGNRTDVESFQVTGFTSGSIVIEIKVVFRKNQIIIDASITTDTVEELALARIIIENTINSVVEIALTSAAAELEEKQVFIGIEVPDTPIVIETHPCEDELLAVEVANGPNCRHILLYCQAVNSAAERCSCYLDLLHCVAVQYQRNGTECDWNVWRTNFEKYGIESLGLKKNQVKTCVKGNRFSFSPDAFDPNPCKDLTTMRLTMKYNCSELYKEVSRGNAMKCSYAEELDSCTRSALKEHYQSECDGEMSTEQSLTLMIDNGEDIFNGKNLKLETCEFCLAPNVMEVWKEKCSLTFDKMKDATPDIACSYLHMEMKCIEIHLMLKTDPCTKDDLMDMFTSDKRFLQRGQEHLDWLDEDRWNACLSNPPQIGSTEPDSMCEDQLYMSYFLNTECPINTEGHEESCIPYYDAIDCIRMEIEEEFGEDVCTYKEIEKSVLATNLEFPTISAFLAPGGELNQCIIENVHSACESAMVIFSFLKGPEATEKCIQPLSNILYLLELDKITAYNSDNPFSCMIYGQGSYCIQLVYKWDLGLCAGDNKFPEYMSTMMQSLVSGMIETAQQMGYPQPSFNVDIYDECSALVHSLPKLECLADDTVINAVTASCGTSVMGEGMALEAKCETMGVCTTGIKDWHEKYDICPGFAEKVDEGERNGDFAYFFWEITGFNWITCGEEKEIFYVTFWFPEDMFNEDYSDIESEAARGYKQSKWEFLNFVSVGREFDAISIYTDVRVKRQNDPPTGGTKIVVRFTAPPNFRQILTNQLQKHSGNVVIVQVIMEGDREGSCPVEEAYADRCLGFRDQCQYDSDCATEGQKCCNDGDASFCVEATREAAEFSVSFRLEGEMWNENYSNSQDNLAQGLLSRFRDFMDIILSDMEFSFDKISRSGDKVNIVYTVRSSSNPADKLSQSLRDNGGEANGIRLESVYFISPIIEGKDRCPLELLDADNIISCIMEQYTDRHFPYQDFEVCQTITSLLYCASDKCMSVRPYTECSYDMMVKKFLKDRYGIIQRLEAMKSEEGVERIKPMLQSYDNHTCTVIGDVNPCDAGNVEAAFIPCSDYLDEIPEYQFNEASCGPMHKLMSCVVTLLRNQGAQWCDSYIIRSGLFENVKRLRSIDATEDEFDATCGDDTIPVCTLTGLSMRIWGPCYSEPTIRDGECSNATVRESLSDFVFCARLQALRLHQDCDVDRILEIINEDRYRLHFLKQSEDVEECISESTATNIQNELINKNSVCTSARSKKYFYRGCFTEDCPLKLSEIDDETSKCTLLIQQAACMLGHMKNQSFECELQDILETVRDMDSDTNFPLYLPEDEMDDCIEILASMTECELRLLSRTNGSLECVQHLMHDVSHLRTDLKCELFAIGEDCLRVAATSENAECEDDEILTSLGHILSATSVGLKQTECLYDATPAYSYSECDAAALPTVDVCDVSGVSTLLTLTELECNKKLETVMWNITSMRTQFGLNEHLLTCRAFDKFAECGQAVFARLMKTCPEGYLKRTLAANSGDLTNSLAQNNLGSCLNVTFTTVMTLINRPFIPEYLDFDHEETRKLINEIQPWLDELFLDELQWPYRILRLSPAQTARRKRQVSGGDAQIVVEVITNGLENPTEAINDVLDDGSLGDIFKLESATLSDPCTDRTVSQIQKCLATGIYSYLYGEGACRTYSLLWKCIKSGFRPGEMCDDSLIREQIFIELHDPEDSYMYNSWKNCNASAEAPDVCVDVKAAYIVSDNCGETFDSLRYNCSDSSKEAAIGCVTDSLLMFGGCDDARLQAIKSILYRSKQYYMPEVEQCFGGYVPEGECPSQYMNANCRRCGGDYDDRCDIDLECLEGHKCCYDGCKMTCLPIGTFETEKAGTCPSFSYDITYEQQYCCEDYDCNDDMKCCEIGYAQTCVPPIEGKLPQCNDSGALISASMNCGINLLTLTEQILSYDCSELYDKLHCINDDLNSGRPQFTECTLGDLMSTLSDLLENLEESEETKAQLRERFECKKHDSDIINRSYVLELRLSVEIKGCDLQTEAVMEYQSRKVIVLVGLDGFSLRDEFCRMNKLNTVGRFYSNRSIYDLQNDMHSSFKNETFSRRKRENHEYPFILQPDINIFEVNNHGRDWCSDDEARKRLSLGCAKGSQYHHFEDYERCSPALRFLECVRDEYHQLPNRDIYETCEMSDNDFTNIIQYLRSALPGNYSGIIDKLAFYNPETCHDYSADVNPCYDHNNRMDAFDECSAEHPILQSTSNSPEFCKTFYKLSSCIVLSLRNFGARCKSYNIDEFVLDVLKNRTGILSDTLPDYFYQLDCEEFKPVCSVRYIEESHERCGMKVETSMTGDTTSCSNEQGKTKFKQFVSCLAIHAVLKNETDCTLDDIIQIFEDDRYNMDIVGQHEDLQICMSEDDQNALSAELTVGPGVCTSGIIIQFMAEGCLNIDNCYNGNRSMTLKETPAGPACSLITPVMTCVQQNISQSLMQQCTLMDLIGTELPTDSILALSDDARTKCLGEVEENNCVKNAFIRKSKEAMHCAKSAYRNRTETAQSCSMYKYTLTCLKIVLQDECDASVDEINDGFMSLLEYIHVHRSLTSCNNSRYMEPNPFPGCEVPPALGDTNSCSDQQFVTDVVIDVCKKYVNHSIEDNDSPVCIQIPNQTDTAAAPSHPHKRQIQNVPSVSPEKGYFKHAYIPNQTMNDILAGLKFAYYKGRSYGPLLGCGVNATAQFIPLTDNGMTRCTRDEVNNALLEKAAEVKEDLLIDPTTCQDDCFLDMDQIVTGCVNETSGQDPYYGNINCRAYSYAYQCVHLALPNCDNGLKMASLNHALSKNGNKDLEHCKDPRFQLPLDMCSNVTDIYEVSKRRCSMLMDYALSYSPGFVEEFEICSNLTKLRSCMVVSLGKFVDNSDMEMPCGDKTDEILVKASIIAARMMSMYDPQGMQSKISDIKRCSAVPDRSEHCPYVENTFGYYPSQCIVDDDCDNPADKCCYDGFNFECRPPYTKQERYSMGILLPGYNYYDGNETQGMEAQYWMEEVCSSEGWTCRDFSFDPYKQYRKKREVHEPENEGTLLTLKIYAAYNPQPTISRRIKEDFLDYKIIEFYFDPEESPGMCPSDNWGCEDYEWTCHRDYDCSVSKGPGFKCCYDCGNRCTLVGDPEKCMPILRTHWGVCAKDVEQFRSILEHSDWTVKQCSALNEITECIMEKDEQEICGESFFSENVFHEIVAKLLDMSFNSSNPSYEHGYWYPKECTNMREGHCPLSKDGDSCGDYCQMDTDCEMDLKCCGSSCGYRHCVKPLDEEPSDKDTYVVVLEVLNVPFMEEYRNMSDEATDDLIKRISPLFEELFTEILQWPYKLLGFYTPERVKRQEPEQYGGGSTFAKIDAQPGVHPDGAIETAIAKTDDLRDVFRFESSHKIEPPNPEECRDIEMIYEKVKDACYYNLHEIFSTDETSEEKCHAYGEFKGCITSEMSHCPDNDMMEFIDWNIWELFNLLKDDGYTDIEYFDLDTGKCGKDYLCWSDSEIQRVAMDHCYEKITKLAARGTMDKYICMDAWELVKCVTEGLNMDMMYMYSCLKEDIEYKLLSFLSSFEAQMQFDFNYLDMDFCREQVCYPSGIRYVAENDCDGAWKAYKEKQKCIHLDMFVGCARFAAMGRAQDCSIPEIRYYVNETVPDMLTKENIHATLIFCDVECFDRWDVTDDIQVTWYYSNNPSKDVEFNIYLPRNDPRWGPGQWIGLGISDDHLMPDSEVVIFTWPEDGEPGMQTGFTTANSLPDLYPPVPANYTFKTGSDTSRSYITLKRPRNVTHTQIQKRLAGSKSLLFAMGDLVNGQIAQHTFKTASNEISFDCKMDRLEEEASSDPCTYWGVNHYMGRYSCIGNMETDYLSYDDTCMLREFTIVCVNERMQDYQCSMENTRMTFDDPRATMGMFNYGKQDCSPLFDTFNYCDLHVLGSGKDVSDFCHSTTAPFAHLHVFGVNADEIMAPPTMNGVVRPLKCSILEDAIGCYMQRKPYTGTEGDCDAMSYVRVLSWNLKIYQKLIIVNSVGGEDQDMFEPLDYGEGCLIGEVPTYEGQCPPPNVIVEHISGTCLPELMITALIYMPHLDSYCPLDHIFTECAMRPDIWTLQNCDEQDRTDALNEYSGYFETITDDSYSPMKCRGYSGCVEEFKDGDECTLKFASLHWLASHMDFSQSCTLLDLYENESKDCLRREFPECQEHVDSYIQAIGMDPAMRNAFPDQDNCTDEDLSFCPAIQQYGIMECGWFMLTIETDPDFTCKMRQCFANLDIPDECGPVDRQALADKAIFETYHYRLGECGGCHDNWRYFENGATFIADDGCNLCTCTAGSVSCTRMYCPPRTHEVGIALLDHEYEEEYADHTNQLYSDLFSNISPYLDQLFDLLDFPYRLTGFSPEYIRRKRQDTDEPMKALTIANLRVNASGGSLDQVISEAIENNDELNQRLEFRFAYLIESSPCEAGYFGMAIQDKCVPSWNMFTGNESCYDYVQFISCIWYQALIQGDECSLGHIHNSMQSIALQNGYNGNFCEEGSGFTPGDIEAAFPGSINDICENSFANRHIFLYYCMVDPVKYDPAEPMKKCVMEYFARKCVNDVTSEVGCNITQTSTAFEHPSLREGLLTETADCDSSFPCLNFIALDAGQFIGENCVQSTTDLLYVDNVENLTGYNSTKPLKCLALESEMSCVMLYLDEEHETCPLEELRTASIALIHMKAESEENENEEVPFHSADIYDTCTDIDLTVNEACPEGKDLMNMISMSCSRYVRRTMTYGSFMDACITLRACFGGIVGWFRERGLCMTEEPTIEQRLKQVHNNTEFAAKFEVDTRMSWLYCPKDTSCEYYGMQKENGEYFDSVDDCNTCECIDGTVSCSKEICNHCYYNGRYFEHKDSFPADDGCNVCHCSEGNVTCTLAYCPPRAFAIGMGLRNEPFKNDYYNATTSLYTDLVDRITPYFDMLFDPLGLPYELDGFSPKYGRMKRQATPDSEDDFTIANLQVSAHIPPDESLKEAIENSEDLREQFEIMSVDAIEPTPCTPAYFGMAIRDSCVPSWDIFTEYQECYDYVQFISCIRYQALIQGDECSLGDIHNSMQSIALQNGYTGSFCEEGSGYSEGEVVAQWPESIAAICTNLYINRHLLSYYCFEQEKYNEAEEMQKCGMESFGVTCVNDVTSETGCDISQTNMVFQNPQLRAGLLDESLDCNATYPCLNFFMQDARHEIVENCVGSTADVLYMDSLDELTGYNSTKPLKCIALESDVSCVSLYYSEEIGECPLEEISTAVLGLTHWKLEQEHENFPIHSIETLNSCTDLESFDNPCLEGEDLINMITISCSRHVEVTLKFGMDGCGAIRGCFAGILEWFKERDMCMTEEPTIEQRLIDAQSNTDFASYFEGASGMNWLDCPKETRCDYFGLMKENGAEFDSIDGCNTCTCMNGIVGCTEIACNRQYNIGLFFGDDPYDQGYSDRNSSAANDYVDAKASMLDTLFGEGYWDVTDLFSNGRFKRQDTENMANMGVGMHIVVEGYFITVEGLAIQIHNINKTEDIRVIYAYPQKPCAEKDLVQCAFTPCDVTSCPYYPEADCVNDFCEKCSARFILDNGLELSDDMCSEIDKCATVRCLQPHCEHRHIPEGDCCEVCNRTCDEENYIDCFAPPCEVTDCPNYPKADCVDNYCGGCNAQFVLNDRDVTDMCEDKNNSVCSEDVDEGTCENEMPYWYFDMYSDSCELFNYTGCGGNGNRFNELEDCRRLCELDCSAVNCSDVDCSHPESLCCKSCFQERAGYCPLVEGGQAGTCDVQCQYDNDCDDPQKCCDSPCGYGHCYEPLEEDPLTDLCASMFNDPDLAQRLIELLSTSQDDHCGMLHQAMTMVENSAPGMYYARNVLQCLLRQIEQHRPDILEEIRACGLPTA